MSDQHPTPQWYTPHGGTTTTEPHPQDAAPTAPIPHTPSSAFPVPPAPPVPPVGTGQSAGPSGSPSRGSGPRRTAELTAVAVLAAILSSGGTLAAARLWDGGTQTPSSATSSTQLGRGTDTAPVKQADAQNPNWTTVSGTVAPSVVAITAKLSDGTAQGSGVIIDRSGHVVTNNHVVSGATSLSVTLSDGRTYSAEVRGTDPSTDLAVITIAKAPTDLTPIALGDSSALKVGDPVMAVGNPLGLAGTVTTGIVSALNRPVRTEAETQQQQSPFDGGFQQQQQTSEPVVTNAIQTSAAINPGNSGGALVNASGQLVGINSSIASLGSSSSSSQSGNIGIGFAIPVNEVKAIATQLIDSGKAQHAYLGVTPQNGSASDGSATRAGAEVTSVGASTPAARAGLKAGDVIVAIDGQPVDSANSLIGHVRERAVGDTVKLTVLRGNASIELSATLAALPAAQN